MEVGKIKTLKKLNFEFFLGVIQDLETGQSKGEKNGGSKRWNFLSKQWDPFTLEPKIPWPPK